MSRVYGFGDCGCKYEVPNKEEFDALVSTTGVFYRETVTVNVMAYETMIVLQNDLFSKKCLVEVYGVAKGRGTPFFSGSTVCIPVSDNVGTKIDVIVKIVYLTEGDSVIKLVNSYKDLTQLEALTSSVATPVLDVTSTTTFRDIIEVPTHCLVYIEVQINDNAWTRYGQISLVLTGDGLWYQMPLYVDSTLVLFDVKQEDNVLKMKCASSVGSMTFKVTKVTVINLA